MVDCGLCLREIDLHSVCLVRLATLFWASFFVQCFTTRWRVDGHKATAFCLGIRTNIMGTTVTWQPWIVDSWYKHIGDRTTLVPGLYISENLNTRQYDHVTYGFVLSWAMVDWWPLRLWKGKPTIGAYGRLAPWQNHDGYESRAMALYAQLKGPLLGGIHVL